MDETARLSTSRGWQGTTTRDIAAAADIATGTLFNYFSTKEDIAAALMDAAIEAGAREFLSRRRGDEPLEEDLFRFIWTALRQMQAYKSFLGDAIRDVFNPLARSVGEEGGQKIRKAHLELLRQVLADHGRPWLSPVSLQIYWALFLGILAHWSADESPHQEDTMALLDQSTRVFVASITHDASAGKQSPTAKEGRP